MPAIEFPEALPVSARRDEIARLLAAHQVLIVCGETGSGKTTQLPKIALALGRGKCNAPPGQGRLIGHTQPRRIAASSVAKRIAEELATPLGEVVGFKVRFQDRLARDASVKLMTDGILLAETQGDPKLRQYLSQYSDLNPKKPDVTWSKQVWHLPFADLLQPAIEIAERGYLVPPVVQQKWAAATPVLQGIAGFAGTFLPWGRAPEVGELFRFPAAARALKAIAATNGDALKSVFREINALEKTNIETSQLTRYAELFPPYLKWAVIFYIAAAFIGSTVLRKGP